MTQPISLFKQLEVGNTLGEGVIWDHRQQCVWWTDIKQNKMFKWSFDDQLCQYDTPESLCSFGFTSDPDNFVCAFASGFALFNPVTGAVQWITKITENLSYNRLNDGRVDRQGRFWAGSMREKGQGLNGALYRLDEHQITKMLSDVQISNSLCWSQKADYMYFADSPKQTIWRMKFEPSSGEIGHKQIHVKTENNAYPDGSCIDSEDQLWNAQWGASQVVRYDTLGKETLRISLACCQPSCVAIGGPDMSYLFVTSARAGLSEEVLNKHPANGNLFIYKTPFKGLEESICTI